MSGRASFEDPPEHRIEAVKQVPVQRPDPEIERARREREERLNALPTRPLLAGDMPALPWRPEYEAYRLREEDGAIFVAGFKGAIGWLDGSGDVKWLRA